MKNSKIAKQILGIFLSLALIISCLPIGLIAMADTTGDDVVLSNPDFEDDTVGLSGWSHFKADAPAGTITSDAAANGSKSLYITAPTDTVIQYSFMSQVFEVEANTEYILTYNGKLVSSGAPQVKIDKTSGGTILQKWVYGNTSSFSKNTFYFNSGDNTSLKLVFVVDNGAAYVDDLKITKKPIVNEVAISNPDFEDETGLEGWGGTKSIAEITDSYAANGDYSLYVNGVTDTVTRWSWMWQLVEVEANANYVFSFNGMREGSGAPQVKILTSSNGDIATGYWVNGSSAFQRNEISFSSGSNTKVKIAFTVDNGAAYVDDLHIGKKLSASVTAGEGGSVTKSFGNIGYGETATVWAIAESGYKFAGWYSGETKVADTTTYSFTATADINLEARFEEIVIDEAVISDPGFEEDFDLEGWSHYKADYPAGTVTDALAANGDYSLYVTEPTDTVIRYSFMNQSVEVEPNTDYVFTFNGLRVNSGSAPQVKIEGTDLSVQKWVNGTGSFQRNEIAFNSGSNTKVKITFTVDTGAAYVDDLHIGKKLSASVTAGEGGSVTKSFNILGYGDSVTVWATANENYKFDGWYSGEEKVADTTTYTFTATADVNLEARFVDATVYEAVLSNPDFEDLDTGLSAWNDSNSLGQITDEYAANGDYSLLVSCEGEGGDTALWRGMNQTFTVTPNTDYVLTFNGKRVDGKEAPQVKILAGSTQIIQYWVNTGFNAYVFNSGSNTTLKIEFTVNAKNTYAAYVDDINVGKKVDFVVTAGEGGTANPSSSNIGYGAVATVWANADEGYKFDGWYSGEEKVADTATYAFTVSGDIAVEARFTKLAAGDFDGDGLVGANDMVNLRQKLLGIGSLSDALADVNGDTYVDIRDLINIKKRMAGLI